MRGARLKSRRKRGYRKKITELGFLGSRDKRSSRNRFDSKKNTGAQRKELPSEGKPCGREPKKGPLRGAALSVRQPIESSPELRSMYLRPALDSQQLLVPLQRRKYPNRGCRL